MNIITWNVAYVFVWSCCWLALWWQEWGSFKLQEFVIMILFKKHFPISCAPTGNLSKISGVGSTALYLYLIWDGILSIIWRHATKFKCCGFGISFLISEPGLKTNKKIYISDKFIGYWSSGVLCLILCCFYVCLFLVSINSPVPWEST